MALPTQAKKVDRFEQALINTKQTTLQVSGNQRKAISDWRLANTGSQADVFRWGADTLLILDEFLKDNLQGYVLDKTDKGTQLAEIVIELLNSKA